ncbi:MAG: RNA polymerase sigma factor [Acidobacteria bacterium]|nr:RNA polymerase sigma factor [Acidobacteriota bacterium]
MSAKPSDDADAAVSRDQDAQNQFISEHLRRVFLLVYRVVGNVEDAQDLTQEVFIKVLQRQEQLRDSEKAAHWLSRIATNTAIDFLRRHKRISLSDLEEIRPPAAPASESPEAMLLRAEKRSRLEAGLSVLTERERVALILRDVEELPAEEVARELNCSKATVRSHIANARVKFKKYLERRKA